MCNINEKASINNISSSRRVWHRFTVDVDAQGDNNAKLYWYERADRAYENLQENNKWEELFEKYRSYSDRNLFSEAYEVLPENVDEFSEEETGEQRDIRFTITDQPEVDLDRGSRTLDIVIILTLTEDESYMAACRQIVEVNKETGELEKAEFRTTGFKKIDDVDEIRGELAYKNRTLNEILETLNVKI